MHADLKLNRGDNKLIPQKKRGRNFFYVKTDILDNYTKNFDKNNCLIKIDVQGEESKILSSSKNTLSKQIPIVLEFEPSNLNKNWKKYFKYILKFYKNFYDLKELKPVKKNLSSENLEKVYQIYFKKNSFTDLLFI